MGETSVREAAPGIPAANVEAVNAAAKTSFYKARVPIYPKYVHGKFRNIKWAVTAAILAVYYILPWIRWERAPGLPNQAFLLDFAHQRMYLFGLELWAQELYFVTGMLVLSALGLFLVTAMAGRMWCGYACWQTVWTDLMMAAEHLCQGDRNARIRLQKMPWTLEKIWKKGLTYLTWLLIAMVTGGTFVFYFADAPSLSYQMLHGEASRTFYVFFGVFTAFTYVFGGMMREQVCTYMCPWPRVQGALFDRDSLLITYRGYRGEPRGPHKKGESWEGRGDCIDCKACVAVCPAGVDIRDGLQLQCIQCALCIDACDEIMKKVGRPTKLIAYDSFCNLDASSHGDRAPIRLIRPRTLYYMAAIAVVSTIVAFGLSMKSVLELNVLPDRNPLFVRLSDGGIRNGYDVHILNKTYQRRTFRLTAEGVPGMTMTAVGFDGKDTFDVEVPPDDVRALKVYIAIPATAASLPQNALPITFKVRDLNAPMEKQRSTNFRKP